MNKIKINLAYCSIILFSAFLLSGCGGYVATSLLPSYIKKINISSFINKSFRPDLPEKINTIVTREFIADGRLTVAGEQDADAILYGEITNYDLQPLSYSEQMNVQEYKVRIILSIWIKDVKENKILWQENNIEVFTTATSSTGGLEVKVESEAINEVIEKIARKIVRRVIDGWV